MMFLVVLRHVIKRNCVHKLGLSQFQDFYLERHLDRMVDWSHTINMSVVDVLYSCIV